MIRLIFFGTLALPAMTFAAAPAAVSLASNVMVEKVVTANGKQETRIAEAKHVLPGDKLIFTTSYRNTAAQVVQHFTVTNPVPSGVVFTGDSSTGVQVSVDGGKSYGALAQLRVPLPGGSSRPAQASDVTHLRWVLASIPAGGQGELRYRGVVR